MDAADLPEELSLADRRKSQVVLKKIPPAAIASAQGLAIFTVFRSGFVVTGAGGSGVVLSRLKDGRALLFSPHTASRQR
jgi:lipid-binding SYLF domain-containing protein